MENSKIEKGGEGKEGKQEKKKKIQWITLTLESK